MQWAHSLSQTYQCSYTHLVTSGCSFTASTVQLKTAASWPGYVMDRCRFDQCIDYSYPGAGNEYIGDSILHFFSKIPDAQIKQYMAVVMWSGIDRKVEKVIGDFMPNLDGVAYRYLQSYNQQPYNQQLRTIQAQESANKIMQVYKYLLERKISFVFSFYSNLLFPPFIPKRDTTWEFNNYLPKSLLTQLQNLPWVPDTGMDFLYEYAFANDFLNSGDYFHPPAECNLQWTDKVLLPGMHKQGLIEPI
jgi:hypothetical protein